MRLLVIVGVMVIACSCGTAPTKTIVPTMTPTNEDERVTVLETSAETIDVVEPAETYSRLRNVITGVHYSTRLYEIEFDASVEAVDAKTLPNIFSVPGINENYKYQANIPDGWTIHTSQHYYSTRVCIDNPNEEYLWETNADNRWDDTEEYVGSLTEEDAVTKAKEWAKGYGYDDVEVIETRAYGKLGREDLRFRSVLLQTYWNGVGVTPEEYRTPTNQTLYGGIIVFMVNEDGCINVRLSSLDIVEQEVNDAPLISLQTAMESIPKYVDLKSDAAEGKYTIRRVALEYVPVSIDDEYKQRFVPAWTFSSAVNYRTNQNMVIWIDARTGEMIK